MQTVALRQQQSGASLLQQRLLAIAAAHRQQGVQSRPNISTWKWDVQAQRWVRLERLQVWVCWDLSLDTDLSRHICILACLLCTPWAQDVSSELCVQK